MSLPALKVRCSSAKTVVILLLSYRKDACRRSLSIDNIFQMTIHKEINWEWNLANKITRITINFAGQQRTTIAGIRPFQTPMLQVLIGEATKWKEVESVWNLYDHLTEWMLSTSINLIITCCDIVYICPHKQMKCHLEVWFRSSCGQNCKSSIVFKLFIFKERLMRLVSFFHQSLPITTGALSQAQNI